MMKRSISILTLAVTLVFAVACNGVRRSPGSVYMPDMMNSRAVETYSSLDELQAAGIFYNARPVEGTFKRGDYFVYPYANDSLGYVQSATVANPWPTLDTLQFDDARRKYNINCGICHGQKLDGNGPLYNGGAGPYTAAPKNFMNPDMVKMAPGTMYHSVTYGKNKMGSYASQLSAKERWMIISYIKKKQAEAAAPADAAPATTATTAPAKDTVKTTAGKKP